MTVYLVTYDLKQPGRNYDLLHQAIKSAGSAWWHYLESSWLIDSSLSANQISEKLKAQIDTNDRLLIINVGRNYDGWLSEEAWDWIRARHYALAA